jgi:uncharacterized repeat protein (TIGR01451 family)
MSNTALVSITSNISDRNTNVEGGGIRVNGHDTLNDSLTMQDNHVINNLAAHTIIVSGTNTMAHAQGGGLCVSNITTTQIIGNEVRENIVVEDYSVKGDGGGQWGGRPSGGGIHLSNGDTVTLNDNDVYDNTTAVHHEINETGATSEGGGVVLENVTNATVNNNTVSGNTAVVTAGFTSSSGNNYHPSGGGIFANCYDKPNCALSLTGNDILNNTTAYTITVGGTDAESGASGGGLDINEVPTIVLNGNWVMSNTALVSITSNISDRNTNVEGGGIRVNGHGTLNDSLTMENNHVIDNLAAHTIMVAGSNAQAHAGGGGLHVSHITTTQIISNYIHSNVGLQNGIADGSSSSAGADGGGLNFNDVPSVTLQRNRIESNEGAASITLLNGAGGGGGGGGISFNQSTVLLQANVISHNTGNLSGDGWGGGIDFNQSTATMNGNLIVGNRMNIAYNGAGGGVWVWESTLTSTNDIFAHNYDGVGGGDNGTPSTITLVNDTLYDNGGIGGSVNDSSTMWVTNTIVYIHVDGLRNDGSGTLTSNYNLLSNDYNYVHVTPGGDDILNQNPSFVNAAADDFHLTRNSPAIDKGSNAVCPPTDYDGNIRPADGDEDGTATCDIGAYEKMFPELWLTKSVEGAPVPGGRIIYTVVITNSGAVTATKAVVSDILASSLIFAGPVKLEPTGAGTPGTVPPILASSLTIMPGGRITVTFPVTVTTTGVVSGTVITNTAVVTCSQLTMPVSGTVTATVSVPTKKVYLPLVLKN